MRASKLVLSSLALASAGCEARPPGDLVGAYAITAELMENSCGEDALPIAETLEYRVQLRRDGRIAYWMLSSPPGSQGTYAGGDVSFAREERFMIEDDAEPIDPELVDLDPIALYGYDPDAPNADPQDAESFCTLVVRESIDATVLLEDGDGAEEDELALEGTNLIEMAPTGDSDCDRVLKSRGGPFERMPCAAEYELSGTLIKSDED